MRERVAAFADPLTRMRLASDGFTTPVLEALLGTMLQVRVLRQDVVPAPAVEPVAGLLRLDDSGEALVRRSCLVDSSLSPVSLNLVVARVTDRWPELTRLDTPIGYSLLGEGAAQRRETVWVGRSLWPRRGELCAAKVYVMLIDDEPVCVIRECFNPRHVPATTAPQAALVLDDDRAWASWLDSVPDGAGADRHDELVFAVGAEDAAAPQSVRPDPAEVAACVGRLRRLPPPVSPTDCRDLAGRLASAVAGEAFVLQLGDCADCAADAVRAWQAVLTAASGMLAFGTGRPVVAVRRVVGQYLLPRPRSVEPVPGTERIPAHPAGPAAAVQHVIDAALPELEPSRADGTVGLVSELGQILDAASAAPAGVSRCLHSLLSPVCTSHEPLVLPYEETLTRWDSDGRWNCSAHMVWLGERTGNPQGHHARFAAQIGNLREFFAVCRERGVAPGGVHLEVAGEPAPECAGGGRGPEPGGLEGDCRPRCNPRLTPAQVLECVAVVLDELRRLAELSG